MGNRKENIEKNNEITTAAAVLEGRNQCCK